MWKQTLLAIVVIICLFVSCRTVDIKNIVIKQIEIELINNNGETVNSVLPSENYYLKIFIYTAESEIISKFDYSAVKISSKNNEFSIIKKNKNEILLQITDNLFNLIEKKNIMPKQLNTIIKSLKLLIKSNLGMFHLNILDQKLMH